MNEYFSHDYKARSDPKLIKLMMRYGLAGIGAYWCIIEMLYENQGYILQTEYERIAFELRTESGIIKSVIEDFELFVFKQKRFCSLTVLKRLKKRQEKSEKARQSVVARWIQHKNCMKDTNVLQTLNDSPTNKQKNKEKDNKEKIIVLDTENKPITSSTSETEKKEKNSAKKERNIIPPSLDMVMQYCNSRNNDINPQIFLDHYAAKGWLIGKEKMVDWQAAIRTWEQRNKKKNEKPKKYGNV